MAKPSFKKALEEHLEHPKDATLYQHVLQLAAANPAAAFKTILKEPPPKKRPRLEAHRVPEVVPAAPSPVTKPADPDLPQGRPAPANNWGGNVPFVATQAFQPVSTKQAAETLKTAVSAKLHARGIGASHSSSIVIQGGGGWLVDSGTLTTPYATATDSSLCQCGELVPAHWYTVPAPALGMLVEVGSGARVQDVLDYLARSNRALSMTGAYTGQTLIGCYMTSTHGAGVQHPPLQAGVQSIQMLVVDTTGKPVEMRIEPTKGITNAATYSRDMPHVLLVQDDDTFLATVVSMGCMGFVLSVIIQTVPPYFLAQESEAVEWSVARRRLLDVGPDGVPKYFAGTYNGGVTLCPYSMNLQAGGEQWTIMSRTRLAPVMPPGYVPAGPGGSTSQLLIDILRLLVNVAPQLTPIVLNEFVKQESTQKVWGPGNKITGSRAKLPQGFSSEHGFPASGIVPALDKVLAQMQDIALKKHQFLVGPISLRYVGATDAFLSMTEGGNRCFAECLTLAGAGAGQQVLAAIEPTALANGSRPHWGQWFSPGAVPSMIATYPQYARWKAVWKRLDPTGTFNNAFTAALP